MHAGKNEVCFGLVWQAGVDQTGVNFIGGLSKDREKKGKNKASCGS